MRKVIWLGLLTFIIAAIAFGVGRNFGADAERNSRKTAEEWPIDPPMHGSDVEALCLTPSTDRVLSFDQNWIVTKRRRDACQSYVEGVAWSASYFQDASPNSSKMFCGTAWFKPDSVNIASHILSSKVLSKKNLMDEAAAVAVIEAMTVIYACGR